MKNILFIGAHADDIEINAGGIISKFIDDGMKINCLILTKPVFSNTRETREREIHFSMKTLNVYSYIYEDIPDTRLSEHINDAISLIEESIENNNIDTIFTHYHADTHQDHKAASLASLAAARKLQNILFYKPTFPSGRSDIPFNPDITAKLKKSHIEKKMESLRCHKSQMKKYGKEEWINRILDIAKADAWVYGGFHGYAEVFQVSRILL